MKNKQLYSNTVPSIPKSHERKLYYGSYCGRKGFNLASSSHRHAGEGGEALAARQEVPCWPPYVAMGTFLKSCPWFHASTRLSLRVQMVPRGLIYFLSVKGPQCESGRLLPV